MRVSIAAATVVASLWLVGSAAAAPPANDAFVDATTIASLPYSDSVDLTESTLEGAEPGGGCWTPARTAWYRIQPVEDVVVTVTTSSGFDRVVNVYRDVGGGLGGLSWVACAYSWGEIVTPLQGGETYYLQLGAPPWSSAGSVGLDIDVVPPPANDDFADATAVGPLPYADTVGMRGATMEAGEPTPSGLPPFTATAWYAFTPADSGSVMVSTLGCCASSQNVAVYTGATVDGLTATPSTRSFGRLIFTAEAGTTYMIQSGHGGVWGGDGRLGIQVEQTPSPVASPYWYPSDPSSFDTVAFQANAWDPAWVGIDAFVWDFGDGGIGTGPSPSHRFITDGDYSVTLTVSTVDGRTTSETRIVSVRTRDVAITKFSVPQSARAAQTRSLTVGIANRREAENVTVQLYRSVPGGGWDMVGQSTQYVPGRSANRTTTFAFSYTFTPADASIGKVTFRAVAMIAGGRDALPADNEAISLPTTVG